MTSDHVKRVKARHESELLGLDFVQGVGIGEAHGQPAIKVYVDVDRGLSKRYKVPRRLEDVPVVIEESGSFRAL